MLAWEYGGYEFCCTDDDILIAIEYSEHAVVYVMHDCVHTACEYADDCILDMVLTQ